jgi:hypothetical protein
MTADSAEREAFITAYLKQDPSASYREMELAFAGVAGSMWQAARQQASTDTRQCTCHPDDRPTVCQKQYAASECQKQASTEAAQGWMDIATAPKDGSSILVMYVHIETQVVHAAFWMSEEDNWDGENPPGWWSYDHSEVSRILLDEWRTPTHWMPLPAAPTAESRKGESNG